MKIILKEDIEKLGKMGDIVEVANGYGRNFLIPTNKAVEATPHNISVIERKKKIIEERLKHDLQELEELSKSINEKSITILRQVGEGEKMFGSVTSTDIAEALETEGVKIDKRQIHLEKPIKELGLFQVHIKLHPAVSANLKVWVVKA